MHIRFIDSLKTIGAGILLIIAGFAGILSAVLSLIGKFLIYLGQAAKRIGL